MKASKYLSEMMMTVVIILFVLGAGSALAWDMRWEIKQEAPSNQYSSRASAIEMREKFDYNSMNTFKGATDGSNGYTVMRNLNGNIMRGYIDKNGAGLLRDQDGNFYRVNTRW
jgi:hypothetical protein